MNTIHHSITGRATPGAESSGQLEPLGVSPRQACKLLSVGNTRLYQLIGDGELESYKDGRSRRITMRSIHARIERKVRESEPTAA